MNNTLSSLENEVEHSQHNH